MTRLLMTVDAVGGVWQYATDLAHGLAAYGIQTVLALLGPAPSAGQRELLGGLRLIETGLPLDWLAPGPEPVLAAGETIARLADELGADLVQLNTPALGAHARFAQPTIAVEHGGAATWWAAVRGGELPSALVWQRDLTRDGLRRAARVVAPTAAHAVAVREAYGLAATPVAIHNGRRPMPLPAAPPATAAFTAGRLWDAAKRTDLLDRIAALAPIRAAGALTGPHAETVRPAHLDCCGPLSARELARELSGRPVFVSAACFEPFGLAILEAAQAGCPLVLSDIASFRELWDGAALFVAGEEPASWANAIAAAGADRVRLGQAAAARADRYTVAATAAAMASVFADAGLRVAA